MPPRGEVNSLPHRSKLNRYRPRQAVVSSLILRPRSESVLPGAWTGGSTLIECRSANSRSSTRPSVVQQFESSSHAFVNARRLLVTDARPIEFTCSKAKKSAVWFF